MSKTVYGVYIAPLKDKSAFKIGKSKVPIERLNILSQYYDFDIPNILIVRCDNESDHEL